MSEWDINFTGRGRMIKGKIYLFEEQLAEVDDPMYAWRQVLMLAQCEEDGTPVMIKVHYV